MCNNYNLDMVGDTNNDNKWDFVLFSHKLGKNIQIEMKEDFMAWKTGNTVVEYECRGKPSGIKTTRASYFVYSILDKDGNPDKHYLIPKKKLDWMIENRMYKDKVTGGDVGSNTKMYRFKLDIFAKNSWELKL